MSDIVRLERAMTRLTRNVSLMQTALSMKPRAALFSLNLEALLSAVQETLEALEKVAPDYRVEAPDEVWGQHVAEALANAVSPEPTPDHIPDSWKE